MEHEEKADRMERVADDMEKQAGKLGDEIDDVREDWRSKQSSGSVPGAVEEGKAGPGGGGKSDEEEAGQGDD
ncbi:MAG: hypothetical protein QOE08_918 [Thermoleophilaceae bacterium]|jgi:hypothetical protein|nr:hypothetical protein [Thermoleophilaceae bacterium]